MRAIRFTPLSRVDISTTNGRTNANQKDKVFFFFCTRLRFLLFIYYTSTEINDPICCSRCRSDDNDYRLMEFRKSAISPGKVILYIKCVHLYPPNLYIYN